MSTYDNTQPCPSLAPGQIGYSFGSQQNQGAPLTKTIAASPGGAVRATNVVTITTTAAHGFQKGQKVTVAVTTVVGATVFDGTFVIATVASTTTFTYVQTAADDTGGAGTVFCPDNVQVEAGGLPANGTAGQRYAMAAQTPPQGRTVTWSHFYNVAPGAITVALQGAMEDLETAYVTLDSDNTAAGITKTVTGVQHKFLRLKITAETAGSGAGMTAKILV